MSTINIFNIDHPSGLLKELLIIVSTCNPIALVTSLFAILSITDNGCLKHTTLNFLFTFLYGSVLSLFAFVYSQFMLMGKSQGAIPKSSTIPWVLFSFFSLLFFFCGTYGLIEAVIFFVKKNC